MNILVIGPSWVGDMMMSHALYQTLKQRYPDCEIDVLAPNWCRALLSRMPEVRRAIAMPIGHGEFRFFARRALGKSLRNQYDLAIVLPNSFKSALIPYFAEIPLRRGLKGESRYILLNDLRKNKRDYPKMVQRYVSLGYEADQLPNADALPIPTPYLQVNPNATDEIIRHAFRAQGERQDENGNWQTIEPISENLRFLGESLVQTRQHQRPVIGFCPGAEFGPAKRWPDRHYAALAQKLIDEGYQIHLFGSINDQPIGEQIRLQLSEAAHAYCFNLAGRTDLTQAIDLIAQTRAVVTNDSGLMHIACAVGRPVIALYGPTSPDYTPPLSDKAKVIRLIEGGLIKVRKSKAAGGFHQSLIDIAPGMVYEQLVAHLAAHPHSS